MAATTRTLVKGALGIPLGVTFHDGRLDGCVGAANRYVLGKLRQTSLAVVTQTEYPEVLGAGQRMIVLRRTPVTGIAVITNDGAAMAASEYRVDAENGFLYRTGPTTGMSSRSQGLYWSTAPDGVQVHYGAGYDASTIPDDLVEAGTQIAASMFSRGALVGLSESDDGATRVKVSEDAVPATARAILARYRDVTP